MDDSSRSTRDTYDAVARRYLERARDRTAIVPHLEAFVRELGRGAVVIDLGAGPGMDTALLVARGMRAIGVDLSMGMLRAGSEAFPGPRVQGDARRLPFAAASVDAVWANASPLHLPPADVGAALGDVRRVLRPRGVLHLALKAGDGAVTETARYGLPRFFQYWTAAQLDAALAANGFLVLAATTDTGARDLWLTRLTRCS